MTQPLELSQPLPDEYSDREFALAVRDRVQPTSDRMVRFIQKDLSRRFPAGTDMTYHHEVVGSSRDDIWTIDKVLTMDETKKQEGYHKKKDPRIVKGAGKWRLVKGDELPQIANLGEELMIWGKRPLGVNYFDFLIESLKQVDTGEAREYEDYYFDSEKPFGLFDDQQVAMTETNYRHPLALAGVARVALRAKERNIRPTYANLLRSAGGIMVAAAGSSLLGDPYDPGMLQLGARIQGLPPLPEVWLTEVKVQDRDETKAAS